jgi:hypothetical protein
MQKVTFRLLKEIDQRCNAHGLRYFLGPQTIAAAMLHHGYDKNLICPDILMPVGDMVRLLSILESDMPADRSVEHMGNSKNFIGFQIAYVDERSTFLQLNRGPDVTNCGGRVNILPIRKNTTGWKALLLKVMETGWESNGFRFTRKINVKTIIAIGGVRLCMAIGKGNLGKILFRRMLKHYDRFKDTAVVKETKKSSVVFAAIQFSSPSMIPFAGQDFPAPKDPDGFMTDYFGETWQELLKERAVNYSETVILAHTPYKEFIRNAAMNGYDIRRFQKDYRRSLIKGIFILPAMRRRAKAILIAKRSGDRLRFYEEFVEKREIIHNLYGNKNFDELKSVFAEHERTTLYYLKRKLGFCVSEEFFDIQCALFRHAGRDDVVEKLFKLVPKEHYKPII